MADTWICVASGPSLTAADCELVRKSGHKIAVVNKNWERFPDADLIYACDDRFWLKYSALIKTRTTAELWTRSTSASRQYSINCAQIEKMAGWCHLPGFIVSGELGGYQMVNLVGHKKPERIILLGYDNQYTDGKKHWHPDWGDGWSNVPDIENKLTYWDQMYLECPIPIINCTRQTAITAFPRASLEDVIL